MMKYNILLACYLFSSLVFADVLYVSFNFASDELKNAEKAATMRGEKLIVYPQISSEDKKRLATIYYQLERSKYTKAIEDVSALEEEEKKITEKYRSIAKKNTLDKLLRSLDKKNVQLSSLVISGHDGNGEFFGNLLPDEANEEELGKTFQKYPDLTKNMRSLLLWGCYTTTPYTVSSVWKKMFPQLEVVAGFDGRAPLSSRESSGGHLKNILVKEKELTQAHDLTSLKKVIKGLKYVPMINASICVDDFFIGKKQILDLKERDPKCDNTEIFQNLKDRFHCYMYAMTNECASPPADTQKGELREIYNQLHLYEHCEGAQTPDMPRADVVIRLMLFNNIKYNFITAKAKELQNMDKLLRAVGAPLDLNTAGLEMMNRRDVLKFINRAQKTIDEKSHSWNYLLHKNELNSLRASFNKMQKVLGNLDPKVVPFGAVEYGWSYVFDGN